MTVELIGSFISEIIIKRLICFNLNNKKNWRNVAHENFV